MTQQSWKDWRGSDQPDREGWNESMLTHAEQILDVTMPTDGGGTIDVGDVTYDDARTRVDRIVCVERPEITSRLGQLGLDQLGGTLEAAGCAD